MPQIFESKNEKVSRIFRYLFSLVIAVFIYIAFAFGTRERRTITIPLAVVPNAKYKSNSNINDSIDIDILGDSNIIYKVNPDKIKAYLDCGVVDKEGPVDLKVDLEYSFGFLEGAKIEIVNRNPVMRINFVKR